MTSRARILIVLVLIALGAGISAVLLLQHHGEPIAVAAVGQACGEGADAGCQTVNASPYAKLAGIPLAAIGLAFYLALALLLGLATQAGEATRDAAAAAALALIGLALVIDAALLAIQAFSLHAYCKLCLTTYVVNAVALVLLLPARRALGALRTALAGEARLVTSAWTLGLLLIAAAVGSSELALRLRAGQRTATLLGTPATPAAPAPAPPTTVAPEPPPANLSPDARRYRDEAERARKEAERLQAILNDPQKLERYFTDKALLEFEHAPVEKIDLEGAPVAGNATAPIRVVTFSDFLCPWCRSLAQALAGFLPQSAGRVAVYFRNYPLDKECNERLQSTLHKGACWTALGGICAHEQGRFWPYHDKVFAAPPANPEPADIVKLAADAGLERASFEHCLSAPAAKQKLTREIAEAGRLQVASTPSMFVNGKRLPRLNDFVQALEKESARLGLPPLPPPKPR
jgi:protein-disulfide isomerase/uncharacterized membrane protein